MEYVQRVISNPPPPSPFHVAEAALDACAAEPIHIPGGIQPCGALLVLNGEDLRIIQVSRNTIEILGTPAETLIGTPLHDLLGREATAALSEALRVAEAGAAVELSVASTGRSIPGLAHRWDGLVIVECYPWMRPESSPGRAGIDVRAIARHTRTGRVVAVPEFADQLAQHVRDVSGYDRVMVYRFDEGGAGEVIAEARAAELVPYKGLWYPASDIPAQARMLYLKKRVRLLGDAQALPVPLVPQINPVTGRPVDLSYATLRAFSPIHLEYMRNMGVRASLVISVIKDDALWGLIACHHRTPRWVDVAVLDACDLLSEMLSVQLLLVERAERADAARRVHEASARLRRSITVAPDWPGPLVAEGTSLLDIVDASGAAVVRGDDVWTVGNAPSKTDVRALASWLERTWQGGASGSEVFAERSIGARDPAFASMPEAIAVLAVPVARTEGSWILWFRPEWIHTVTWAGAPAKIEETVDGEPRLSPRRSFAAWAHEVRGVGRPWTEVDRSAATLMRAVLVEELLGLLTYKNLIVSQQLVRVRQAVLASSEAMVITDGAGRILLANSVFYALAGFVGEGREGAPFDIASLLESAEERASLLATLEGEPPTWRAEVWIRSVTGERLPVEMRVDRIRDDSGVYIGLMTSLLDLRERYRIAEERRRLELRMLQAQKLESLGVLAGGIAHDFNNLLTTILCNASLAHALLADDSPAATFFDNVEASAARAAELCRRLLAYAGRSSFVVEPLDIDALLASLQPVFEATLSKRATLDIKVHGRLPFVDGDAEQIRQLVMDLMTNASDALGDDAGVITVTTDLLDLTRADLEPFEAAAELPEGAYVVLKVKDTGRGMDAATVARIFDPFFSTKFTGRGLGLAASVGIVRGHRGGLRVQSEPGSGATFTLVLPATTRTQPAPSSTASVSLDGVGLGRTALVVDDDDGVRVAAARSLAQAGFTVLEAADGFAGVEAFRAHAERVDIVILDLIMPVKGGRETLTELRTIRPDVRVLLSSGYTEEDALGRMAECGVLAFIQKPYRSRDLVQMVAALTAQPATP